MKRCPKCGNDTFEVIEHVSQCVLVDGNGNWIDTLETCDIVHRADDQDIWMCAKCAHEAAGAEFNVKE